MANSGQNFLDTNQYTRAALDRYERIFGEGFLSSGGIETTQKFVPLLHLAPGSKVLDVGSGLGGSAFYMAREFGATVTGIDLSKNMVDIANEKLAALKAKEDAAGVVNGVSSRVNFINADIFDVELPAGEFDAVYSRDAILHIGEKQRLFTILCRVLKPAGRLLITDYCCVDNKTRPHSDEFKAYIADREYKLVTVAEYGAVLGASGFVNITAKDVTHVWLNTLETELARISGMQDSFVRDFGQDDFTKTVKNWETKIVRANGGEQTWGLFLASRPQQQLNADQTFLDSHQYTRKALERYERIFGEGFLSSGGIHTTRNYVPMLKLQQGERVLDIGSGLGGSATFMAKTYGVSVQGVDLSRNMVEMATEKKQKLALAEAADATLGHVSERINYMNGNIFEVDIPKEGFNAAYSRDAIMHIGEKHKLFKRIFSFLKPGGRLLITDYCWVDPTERPHSQKFIDYIKDRDYKCVSVEQYGKILESVGFVNVHAEDVTSTWVDVLKMELESLKGMKEPFIADFGVEEYEGSIENWETKIVRAGEGEQTWGLFVAYKPL